MKKDQGTHLLAQFSRPLLSLALAATLITPYPVLVQAEIAARTPAQAGAPAAPSTDVCESRRPLTLAQSDVIMRFNADLSWLDNYRSGPDAHGLTYDQKLDQIIQKDQPQFTTEELKDVAAEYLLLEQFKQLLFKTVGLDSREFANYIRVQKDIEFFSGSAPRELQEAVAALQNRIYQWSTQQQSLLSTSGDTEAQAAKRLQILAQSENVLALLDIVSQTLDHTLQTNAARLDDQLAAYRHYFLSFLSGATVVGTMAVSAPIVGTASATLGAAGVVLSGCALGAAGGGAAAILQSQYSAYSTAWIESYNHKTAYACELRRALITTQQDIWHTFTHGAEHGAIAGCAFTGAGMVAPRLAVYTVTGAVAIATTAEGVMAAKNAYLATHSYLVYRSLLSMQKAEASADQPAQAAMYLKQAQDYAQQAGAHGLNAILVGIVLVGGPAEIQHALTGGREAIVALIGKSSDNAAVAVSQIGQFASGMTGSSQNK